MKKAQEDSCTTGKSSIGDEKAWNVFMRLDTPEAQYVILPPASVHLGVSYGGKKNVADKGRKATGETEPVKVMAKLRELKNNM